MANVINLDRHRQPSPEGNSGESSIGDDEQRFLGDGISGLTGEPVEATGKLGGQQVPVGISEAAFSPQPDTIVHAVNKGHERELRVYIREPRGSAIMITEETFRVGLAGPYYDRLEYPEEASGERALAIAEFDPAEFARSLSIMPAGAPPDPSRVNHTLTFDRYERARRFIGMCDAGTAGNRVEVPTGHLPFQNA
jgi:hypothetical protein